MLLGKRNCCEDNLFHHQPLTRFSLQVHIRKVKLLKAPKFDLGALMALHGESGTDDQGQKVEREFKERVLEEV